LQASRLVFAARLPREGSVIASRFNSVIWRH
jgi:hypothetical protein